MCLGRVRTKVQGAKARHYPDTQWLEIDRVRVRSFDAQGRITTATAERGLTNEDSSEVQLIGNAVLVREAVQDHGGALFPRMEYRGEFLHAFMNTERVESHKPVELLRGKDRFAADRMEFDNVEQVLQFSGWVRGTLMPAGSDYFGSIADAPTDLHYLVHPAELGRRWPGVTTKLASTWRWSPGVPKKCWVWRWALVWMFHATKSTSGCRDH